MFIGTEVWKTGDVGILFRGLPGDRGFLMAIALILCYQSRRPLAFSRVLAQFCTSTSNLSGSPKYRVLDA